MKTTLISVFLAALLVATATQADTGGADVGDIVGIYQEASKQFQDSINSAAFYLFVSLLGISIAWSLGLMALKQADIPQILVFLIPSIVVWGFQYKLMTSDWLKLGIDGFIQIGKNSTGMSGLNPGDILWQGLDLVSMMFTKYSAGSWLSILSNPFSALIMAACTIMVLIAFLVLTAQVAITSAQMYFYLAVAPLLIAFGALKASKDIATKAISSVVSYGLRFLAIYFVVFVAQKATPMMGDMLALANNMPDNTSDPYGFKPLLGVVAFSSVLAWLAMQVPKFADGVLQGVSSMSAGDAIGPGVAAAAGAAGGAIAGGAVSGASAAGSTATQGLTSLREAASAAFSGGGPSSMSGLSGMSTGGAYSSPGGAVSDLNPSWFSDPAGSASSGSASTNTVSPNSISGGDWASSGSTTTTTGNTGSNTPTQNSQGGSISGGSSGVEQPAIAASSSLADQASSGGSIGGANSNQPAQSTSSKVADGIQQGLQDFAQHEKSSGASVNIQLGHEEF
jgi:type IV secretion system protein TrbL